jgi:hypothetical protein
VLWTRGKGMAKHGKMSPMHYWQVLKGSCCMQRGTHPRFPTNQPKPTCWQHQSDPRYTQPWRERMFCNKKMETFFFFLMLWTQYV